MESGRTTGARSRPNPSLWHGHEGSPKSGVLSLKSAVSGVAGYIWPCSRTRHGADFFLWNGFGCTRLAAEGSSHEQAQERAKQRAELTGSCLSIPDQPNQESESQRDSISQPGLRAASYPGKASSLAFINPERVVSEPCPRSRGWAAGYNPFRVGDVAR